MNLLNKKNQHYDVLGRFRVNTGRGEMEFCRVKFMATKHEDVIPATKVETGDFEDTSIAVRPTPVKPVTIEERIAKAESKITPTATQIATKVTAVEYAQKEFEGFIEENVKMDEPVIKSFDIIATNPKGEEITVNSIGLDAFCSENKLDLEGVQSVIEGKQKTHRKWRFRTV